MIDHAIEDARKRSRAQLEACDRGAGGCSACRAALDELDAIGSDGAGPASAEVSGLGHVGEAAALLAEEADRG